MTKGKRFPALDAPDLHDAALQVWGGEVRRIDLTGQGPDGPVQVRVYSMAAMGRLRIDVNPVKKEAK
jgi:hypothetical protein